MSKFSLPPIAPSADITSAVNNRLQKIVDELNNKVLYRGSPLGEPNALSNDIDMAGNDILNAKTISCNSIIVAGEIGEESDADAILELVDSVAQLEDDVVLLQAADVLLDGRLDSLEVDVPAVEGRLDVVEPIVSANTDAIAALDSRVGALEDYEECLITVNTNTIPLTIAPQTISGNLDILSQGITREADGSINYPTACRYIASWALKLATTTNTTVYLWVEKYNTTTEEWDILPYSGLERDLPSLREVEISSSYLRLVSEEGARYRLRMSAIDDGDVSLTAVTLPNGVVMPSVRLDIRN